MQHILKELKDRQELKISCEVDDAEELVFLQSLLFRVIELAESSTKLNDEGSYLASLCLQRALLETIIITICFHSNLRDITDKTFVSADEYNEFANKYFHSQRTPELSEIAEKLGKKNTKATNIVTRLKKVKELGHVDLYELYDLFSQYIHNSLGITHFYSTKENDSFILSQNLSSPAEEAIFALVECYKHIKVFIKHFDEIQKIFLPKLLSIGLRRKI